MFLHLHVPRAASIYAVQQLALVDYNVANRVTEDVATVVQWAYQHDMPWIPPLAMQALQSFDSIGSTFIAIVIWLVGHTV